MNEETVYVVVKVLKDSYLGKRPMEIVYPCFEVHSTYDTIEGAKEFVKEVNPTWFHIYKWIRIK